MTDQVLTTAQVAERLGITPSHVRRLAIRLDLGRKVGRDRLFDEPDVEQLERRITTPGPRPRNERTDG